MKLTPVDCLKLSKSRTSRQGIERPIESCTKYYNRVLSTGDIGRLNSFNGLVGQVVD
ncbi:UNVERIFIED_CONTAM: hypothetical protein Sradi_3807800 [Sesamum radiatum]|uniref:ATP synthase beta subunit n=1 Tax=Sesamum radiatum TaxID=300843 RepID=A0AAW2Q0G3_SESRA